MYEVLVEKIQYGRRTYKKGSLVNTAQVPEKLLKELEKDGKVKKETKTAKK